MPVDKLLSLPAPHHRPKLPCNSTSTADLFSAAGGALVAGNHLGSTDL